ncbi:MAG TPA: NAD-dependent malic enzyme [Frankiaceae bacterium]|nr:NAD-dependent malic enzyme [Frankiaceae bacterium]
MHPSASFSATIRVRLDNRPGAFASVARAIGEAGGLLDAIDLVRVERGRKIRDVTVFADDAGHLERIVQAVRAVEGVDVGHVSDRTFLLHLGGKLEMRPKVPLTTRDDLSMVYTPGVARVCRAIADDPGRVWNLTIKQNMVAVVTDGTAVLGLGDIGPEAALPVMEGKAVLFKEFGGVDAFPLCLSTTDPDQIVATVMAVAPVFGGINLEDIAAPRCFEIEARLRTALDIPVFHDDQHGTAVVVLAALLNALRLVGKRLEEVRIVISGVGAAGIATTKMLLAAGAGEVIGCDRRGIVHSGRPDLDGVKAEYARLTNPRKLHGGADDALAGADVFIGLSGPGAVSASGIRSMAKEAIVFAMANPSPEVAPEDIEGVVAVVGTGRSDYPNQINNVLAFPGIFRGALDVRASDITEDMQLAAAHAIASVVQPEDLAPDFIIPSVFDRSVAPIVAEAVARAASEAGVGRRPRVPGAEEAARLPTGASRQSMVSDDRDS